VEPCRAEGLAAASARREEIRTHPALTGGATVRSLTSTLSRSFQSWPHLRPFEMPQVSAVLWSFVDACSGRSRNQRDGDRWFTISIVRRGDLGSCGSGWGARSVRRRTSPGVGPTAFSGQLPDPEQKVILVPVTLRGRR
jgi:hypothetical protein